MTERNDPTKLWPTYALRAWLTVLLAQIQRAETEQDTEMDRLEKELAGLRAQKARSGTVLLSLREAIAGVDNILRRMRDIEATNKNEPVTEEQRNAQNEELIEGQLDERDESEQSLTESRARHRQTKSEPKKRPEPLQPEPRDSEQA